METRTVWLWEEDYPHSLSDNELSEPLGVIGDFFKEYSLTDCQYLLWEWQHCHYRPYIWSIGDGLLTLFRFYRFLEKLLDVAWLFVNDTQTRSQLQTLQEIISVGDIFQEYYFVQLQKSDLEDPFTDFFSTCSLQWWKNILSHWWSIASSYEQLDDDTRVNPLEEIPQFFQLIKMIESQFTVYLNMNMNPVQNYYSAFPYLSNAESSNPFLVLTKLFSKYEYEDHKEKLRWLFYQQQWGMEEYDLSDSNGLVHSYHKLIAIGKVLILRDQPDIENERIVIGDGEPDMFWGEETYLLYHHLNEEEFKNPHIALNNLLSAYELHQMLHRFTDNATKFRVNDYSEKGQEFTILFQNLEKLIEALYLVTLEKIQID